jgi:hypothetical protein
MLPFNSERQANRVRHDNNSTEEAWNARSKAIRDEHRLPDARNELRSLWEIRLTESKEAAVADAEEDDDVAIPMEG